MAMELALNLTSGFLRVYRISAKDVKSMDAYQAGEKLNCGVPHGSIIGPLLLITYINDITTCCKLKNINLHADDTNISSVGCKPEDSETDLNEIGIWLLANKFSLILKTVQINLTVTNQQYSMDNCPVTIIKVQVPWSKVRF